MNSPELNRASGIGAVALAAIAFLAVLSGYFIPPPQHDEGTQAHIFQLALIAQMPVLMLFLATCEWKRPYVALRPVALQATILLLAFAGLFHLEHP